MKLPTQKYSQDLRKYYRLPAVQVSLTLVLSLFVMAIFIVFALRPTLLSIVTLNKTIEESKKTLKILDTKVTNLQKASKELESIQPFLQKINANIPNNSARYSPLTKAVESLAVSTEVTIETESLGSTLLFSRVLSPFTPSKSQKVVTLPFTVRVTGNYPNVSVFLTKILMMERVIEIESITITKEAGAKKEIAPVSLSITGSAYYLADEAQLQKAIIEEKGKK